MDQKIPSKDRVFISITGAPASEKFHLIFQKVEVGNFSPSFDKTFLFHQYFQKMYVDMQKEVSKIQFIGSMDFHFIENFPNKGTTHDLRIVDSCDENSRIKQSEKIPVAGRHREINCIKV